MNRRIVIIRNASPEDFGGGERFPVFLSEALTAEGYSPVIISRSEKLLNFARQRRQPTIRGWWWQRQRWSGIHNLLLPFYACWQVILFVYYLVLFLKLKPAVVHIQSKDDFIAATLAANCLRTRVIWTDHADLKHVWKNLALPWKNPIGKFIHKLAKSVPAITLVSESEKAFIIDELPKNSPIINQLKVIYNGVTDVSSHYSRKPHKNFTFLIASRLVTDKGIGEAITAFKDIYSSHKDVLLVIVGDGPEKRKFKKQASDCPAITFLGYQSDPIEHMAQADAFLLPTYHEGFSVALVEAGMMSLPIIATNVGGNTEIITNNKTGLLVQVKDSDTLYEAMLRVYKDKELSKTIGSGARLQFVKKFQFDHIVKKSFIPLYRGDE